MLEPSERQAHRHPRHPRDDAHVGCLTLTPGGTIVDVNSSGAQLLGAKRQQLMGRRMVHYVQPGDRESWYRFFLAVSKRPCSMECELHLRHADGRSILASLSGTGLESPDGGVSVHIAMVAISAHEPSPASYARQPQPGTPQAREPGSAWDGGTRRAPCDHRSIDALASRICVFDERGRIIATDKAWREREDNICNAMHHDIPCTGCSALECLTPYLSPASATEIKNAIEELLSGKRQTFFLEYELTRDTEVRWFEMRAMRFPDRGPTRFVVTHDDISARKHAADEQRRNAERLKQLRAHLEYVMERQSAMIARELHDELGATLTMLRLGLATTAEVVDEPELMRSRFDLLIDQVDTALQVVKRVSSNLRPATLDMLGLIPTIKWYVTQFTRSTGITATLHLPEHADLSSCASTTVFRIIQEGLTNVARHSGASAVSIRARASRGALIVRLKDNGSGFPQDELRHKNSFGVLGMRERAEHLGGWLSIRSTPRHGTRLVLCIPLDGTAGRAAEPEKRTC